MMRTKYRKSKSGTVFKPERGKLYVFTSDSVTVMRGWPRPMAWKKTREKPTWVCCRPEIAKAPVRDLDGRIRRLENPAREKGQTLLPFFDPPDVPKANRAKLAWLKWFNTIPRDVRRLMARYSSRQWHMLSFLARCGPAAADLTESNPALAFALASNWVYHKPPVHRPLRSARALLSKKQRRILGWLGFPETESARKGLSKITPKAVNIPSLLYLRPALADCKKEKLLCHLPRLNAGAIRIATDPQLFPYASFNLIGEVAHRRKEDARVQVAYILRDIVNMHRLLGKQIRPVASLSRLLEVHDSLIDELNQTRICDKGISFPPPPVDGNENIVPITSGRELIEEGKIQHNCVASYLERIAVQQRVYIYRVLFPEERCTLSLTKYNKKWVISELKRACNEPPSPIAQQRVQKWLAGAACLR